MIKKSKLIHTVKSLSRNPTQAKYRNALIVFAAVTLSTWISFWAFRESPRTILKNAIALNGDGALIGIFIKLANENSYGSILKSHITSSNLGWPGQLDFSTFPVGQLGDILLVKTFSTISNITDPGILIHVFSILKVIPICLAVIILGRTLKISFIGSSTVAVAYSISTYNLVRSEGHFFLGFTWTIPLGLAAISIAFRLANMAHSQQKSKFGNRTKLFALIIPVSISTFYYTFFIALLTITLLLLFLMKEFLDQRSATNRTLDMQRFKAVISRLSGFLIIGASIAIGIGIQLVRTFTHERHSALTGIADRSPIESVIYGGTFEGFFFDSAQLVLNIIKRQDLLNFMASRVSWEGAQVGAFAGFAVYILVAFVFLQLIKVRLGNNQNPKPKITNSIPSELWLIYFLLFVAASLYIIGPVNFGISRIIPEIRAWGRVSTILTLLILIATALLIETYLKKIGLKVLILFLVLVIPLSEVYYFRSYRPVSSTASTSVQLINSLREGSLRELKDVYQKNCPLFLAPVYPFPEYERADDTNFDYAQLALPLEDDGYFRWSAAAIKSTGNSKAWQPLASVQPTFARATIAYQLDYAQSLGACGAIVDRSLLTVTETKDLSNYLSLRSSECIKNLTGEEFAGISRFLSIAFDRPDCSGGAKTEVEAFMKSNLQSGILWQIDQPYGLEYLDQWQMFPGSTPIALRLVESKHSKSAKPEFKIRISALNNEKPMESLSICVRRVRSTLGDCQVINIGESNTLQFPIESEYLKSSVVKLELYLSPESVQLIEKWGAVIESKFSN
jgi:hypothetical protein